MSSTIPINKSIPNIISISIITALTFTIANVWNNTITDIIQIIYPFTEDENNKRKYIISILIYTIIVTIALVLIIKLISQKIV